ncbi:MAG: rhodanese-like domain-containing protein [Bacteroidota bacterium]
MRVITAHDLKDWIDKGDPLLIVDIRDADEFEDVRIKGSVNYPRLEFDKHIADIPFDIPVVLLCKYGKKSEQINLNLRADHKHKNTYSLLGGLFEWSREIDKSMVIW